MGCESQIQIDSHLLGLCSQCDGEVCARDGEVGVISLVVAAEL